MRVNEFWEKDYLPHAMNNKRSWQYDVRCYKAHIKSTFGNRDINNITIELVDLWQDGLAVKYSKATISRISSLLKSMLNLAERHKILKRENNIAKEIKIFPVSKKERFLSIEECKKLKAALEHSDSYCADIIMLLLLTGARKSEIFKARWKDIDFERKTLTVPISKDGKPRIIELSDNALEIFGKYRGNKSQWIFPSRGRGKKENHVGDIFFFWNNLRQTLGLQDVRLHDLRHTYASLLVNQGQSLYVVQRLLGHKSPSTTMRYAHLDRKILQDAANAVGAAI